MMVSVVVADDTPDIRMLLRLILNADGRFAVVGEARDGREAVAMATTLHPDAVILDLAMPVMDGLQALPRIVEASPESKVVVLSGFNASQMRAEALALGAAAYMEKGVAHDELVSLLVDLCPKQAQLDGAQPDGRSDLPHAAVGR
jgi:DNA-binding NarL/FixJ family response regulator